MITVQNLVKTFDGFTALGGITCTIPEGSIYGMVGSNGAGKSTFLRLLCGIYKPDSGSIYIDGMPVWENPKAKELFMFVPDDLHFINGASMERMAKLYASIYKSFDFETFKSLAARLKLPTGKSINGFSKGMKRQAAIILALSTKPKYIFFDETFDGLDPVMRQAVKSIFAQEIAERGLTPVIASHNLRELEDICDHVGLLHRGGVLLSRDLEDMKVNIHKVQCAFKADSNIEEVLQNVDVVKKEIRGSLYTITARGNADDIRNRIQTANPIFMELLPLSLEEIFISETEVAGYDIKKLIF